MARTKTKTPAKPEMIRVDLRLTPKQYRAVKRFAPEAATMNKAIRMMIDSKATEAGILRQAAAILESYDA